MHVKLTTICLLLYVFSYELPTLRMLQVELQPISRTSQISVDPLRCRFGALPLALGALALLTPCSAPWTLGGALSGARTPSQAHRPLLRWVSSKINTWSVHATDGRETGAQGHWSVNPTHSGVMSYTEQYWEESYGPVNAGVCAGTELQGCGTTDVYSGPYLELECWNFRFGFEAGFSSDGPYMGCYVAVAHDHDDYPTEN